MTNFHHEVNILWASDGATVSFMSSTVERNRVWESEFENAAVFSVNAVTTSNGADQDTIVQLEDCVVEGNLAENEFVAGNGKSFPLYTAIIYSDILREVHYVDQNVKGSSLPLSAVPAERVGISSSSAWILQAQTVCCFGQRDAYKCSEFALHHCWFN